MAKMHTSFTVMLKVGKPVVVPIGTGLLPRLIRGVPKKTVECDYVQARVKARRLEGAGAGKCGLSHAMVLGIEGERDRVPNRCTLHGKLSV